MVTFGQPVLIGANLWRVPWTSDQVDPTYRIYVDGELVGTQTGTTFDIWGGQQLEVIDNDVDAPQPGFPGYLVLGWNLDTDALEYLIEEYVGGVWTTRATIAAVLDEAWQTYRTGILDDETTHQWRVTPYDAAGNAGTAVSFSVLMVRYPDVPDVTYTYSSGTGAVTIAAA